MVKLFFKDCDVFVSHLTIKRLNYFSINYLCSMLKSTLLKATEAGANELRRFFNGSFKISNKEGINNLVTEADHASEKAIIDVIKREYPEHFILREESGESGPASEYKWIVDPIDGTVNFANGIPICCVSIARRTQW